MKGPVEKAVENVDNFCGEPGNPFENKFYVNSILCSLWYSLGVIPIRSRKDFVK